MSFTGSEDAQILREYLCDPSQVCGSLGLLDGIGSYKRQPQGVIVRCPWHPDNSPSCSVRVADDGTISAKCFACGGSGDALGFIAAVRGIDPRNGFVEVLREAAQIAGIRLPSLEGGNASPLPPPPPRPATRPTTARPKLSDDDYAELAEALLYWCSIEKTKDREAKLYLAQRGVLPLTQGWGVLPADSEELEALRASIIDKFGSDTWERSGLARKDGEWLYAEHRLLIPWCAPSSDVLALQRRPTREIRPNEPKYLVPQGREFRYPFGIQKALELIDDATEVVFCEGAFDALSYQLLAERMQRPCVVLGCPGTQGWRSEWAEYARGRNAVIALDPDEAGTQAVALLERDLVAAGALRVTRSRPRGAKDWNAKLMAEAV